MSRTLNITIYEEAVPSRSTTIAGIIMAVLAAGFLVALIEELFASSDSFAWAVIAGLFCLSLVISIFQLLKRKLKIFINTEAITLSFTYKRLTIPFHEIGEYTIDEGTARAYKGQGVFRRKTDGIKTLVYSSTKSPKIILDMKEGEYGRIAFSTRQPERIIAILTNRIGS